METSLEQLAQRVGYLERELKRHGVLLDHQQADTDTHLADIQQHLDQQDITQQELNLHMVTTSQQLGELTKQVSTLAQTVQVGFESVNQRFEHVYGELADTKANIVEVRNIVADLVQRK